MNNLSWLIYGIGVADSMRDIAQGILIACGFVTILGGIFGPMAIDLFDFEVDAKAVFRSARNWIVSTVAICCLVVTFAPSRQTLLLIAGSEIGERVVMAPSVQSVIEPGADLLRTWISEETRRLKGKSKE